VCRHGKLTVALLVRESRERREAKEMRKTERYARFLLPTTCTSDAVVPYTHTSSHAALSL
jgi:hypothetical protein